MRALIVDDSKFIRDFVHSLFEGRSVVCVDAENGIEALERLRQSVPFAFALVDWNMPVMNGFDVLQSARADQGLDRTKFIMMTTEAENDHIEAALLAGADEYIIKPFDEEGLFEKLSMAGIDGI